MFANEHSAEDLRWRHGFSTWPSDLPATDNLRMAKCQVLQ